jgi:predicted site-specific integrase-resolvase
MVSLENQTSILAEELPVDKVREEVNSVLTLRRRGTSSLLIMLSKELTVLLLMMFGQLLRRH